jgi:glycosyltransferase involved in cell wall biosynthesis
MGDNGANAPLPDVRVCGMPFYYSVEDVLKRQAGCFDVVYLHRLSNAQQYLSLARIHQPKARILYSVADLHYVRLTRQGEVQRRPELVRYGQHVASAEYKAAHLADAVITHSPAEAKLLAEKVRAEKVHVVPWAVTPRPSTAPFADRRDLAVIGQFGHPPNPDSVHWLTRQVMPLVWAREPTIRCLVVGHDWTAERLPSRDMRVEVVGPVEDLAEIFAQVRLTVAPLRFGAGIKGKVLESFAAGIPCVMSPVAAEGLALASPLAALVANDAEAMARAILRYHSDVEASQAAAAAGLAMIARDASEARVTKAMAGALSLRPPTAC